MKRLKNMYELLRNNNEIILCYARKLCPVQIWMTQN